MKQNKKSSNLNSHVDHFFLPFHTTHTSVCYKSAPLAAGNVLKLHPFSPRYQNGQYNTHNFFCPKQSKMLDYNCTNIVAWFGLDM